MNITVIIKDDFGYRDATAFDSIEAAAEYALPFAQIQSYVVMFRFGIG